MSRGAERSGSSGDLQSTRLLPATGHGKRARDAAALAARRGAIQDLRIRLRRLLRATADAPRSSHDGWPRHRSDDVSSARERDVAAAAAYADQNGSSDLHGLAAEQVPLLGGRLVRRSTRTRHRFERIAGYQSRALAFSDGKVAGASDRAGSCLDATARSARKSITPALGRDFTESDGRPGSPRTVIVSQSFWQRRRLGGRADAIGKPVTLDGVDCTVAGVLPPSNGPLEPWPALLHRRAVGGSADAQGPVLHHGPGPPAAPDHGRCRGSRRRGGRAARNQQGGLFGDLEELVSGLPRDVEHGRSLRTFAAGDLRPVGALALAAVGFVWLIACTNASNLLIARVSSRRRRLGVRTALGASRALASSATCSPRARCWRSGAAAVGLALAWSGIGVYCAAGHRLASRGRRRSRSTGPLGGCWSR